MGRAIAFLRAINVGGRTVKMDNLRDLFTGMGFANVETFIASGNVIFDSPEIDTAALERTIEAGLQAGLGFWVDAFVRTLTELATTAATWPFSEADRSPPDTLFIAFLASPPPAAARDRLLALTTAVDAFHVAGREVYWLRRDALGESALSGAALEKALGQPATVRNARTVRRLVLKYEPASPCTE